jgi:hypothetical protein
MCLPGMDEGLGRCYWRIRISSLPTSSSRKVLEVVPVGLVAFAVGLFTLRDDGIDLCGCFENHCGGWIRFHLPSWTAISVPPMILTFLLDTDTVHFIQELFHDSVSGAADTALVITGEECLSILCI